MEIAAAIAAAEALLKVVATILDDEEREKYERMLARIVASAPSIETVLEFIRDVSARISAGADMRALQLARAQNPAFSKRGIAGTAGCLLLALALSSCCRLGAVREIPETEEYRAGYGVVWPADVDPAGFQTAEQGGRWVTTVPRLDGEIE